MAIFVGQRPTSRGALLPTGNGRTNEPDAGERAMNSFAPLRRQLDDCDEEI